MGVGVGWGGLHMHVLSIAACQSDILFVLDLELNYFSTSGPCLIVGVMKVLRVI